MSISFLQAELASGRLTITVLDDGSGVLLDARGEQLFSMNATGLTIVQEIAEGVDNPKRIASILSQKFRVDPDRAEQDVEEFVARLSRETGP